MSVVLCVACLQLIIFKKHRRKGYRKTSGYRHKVTLLRVDRIDYDAEADKTAVLLKEDKPAAATFASIPKLVPAAAAPAAAKKNASASA